MSDHECIRAWLSEWICVSDCVWVTVREWLCVTWLERVESIRMRTYQIDKSSIYMYFTSIWALCGERSVRNVDTDCLRTQTRKTNQPKWHPRNSKWISGVPFRLFSLGSFFVHDLCVLSASARAIWRRTCYVVIVCIYRISHSNQKWQHLRWFA